MRIEVLQNSFNPWVEVSGYQASQAHLVGTFGATTVFVGTMRDFNEGDSVQRMTLEHYPGMTEKHLEKIARAAMQHYDIADVMIVHRVGEVEPGEPIVCVAVWSAHRKAAYDANRFVMEDLKSRAPFWKKEELNDGSRWVEENTKG